MHKPLLLFSLRRQVARQRFHRFSGRRITHWHAFSWIIAANVTCSATCKVQDVAEEYHHTAAEGLAVLDIDVDEGIVPLLYLVPDAFFR